MDAGDVAFSMSAERLRVPEPMAPRGARHAASIVRAEATGPLTVEVELDIADPAFPNRLGTPLGFVLPEDHSNGAGTDAFGQKPVGTGPYRLARFDPSSVLVAASGVFGAAAAELAAPRLPDGFFGTAASSDRSSSSCFSCSSRAPDNRGPDIVCEPEDAIYRHTRLLFTDIAHEPTNTIYSVA